MSTTGAKKSKSDTLVTTDEVRFSYVHAFEPSAMKDAQGQLKGDPKYSVNIIIKKGSKQLDRIQKGIEAAKAAGLNTKFNGKIPTVNFKIPLRDGDVERPDDPNYAGCMFINASSKTKPGVIDANGNPIIDSTEFYSGCYGRASINFYPFNRDGGKGIAAGLNNLQKLRDGEALGGRTSAEEDFADPIDELEA